MAGLTAKEIKQFDQIADTTSVTMLVVADSEDYPVLYGSNMNLLGYSDSEIRGIPLGRLLPEEVREMHPKWMEGFKAKALQGEALGMADGKIIPGMMKNGSRKNIKIDIDYIPRQRRPYFLGFLQPEGDTYANILPLYNLKTKIDAVMESVEKEFNRRVQSLGGGITGVVLAITGIFTPVWPAIQSGWKAASAAFTSPATSSTSGEVTVTAKLDDRQRDIRLDKIRDSLIENDSELLAVVYYDIKQSFNSFDIFYRTDTETQKGEEVWFFDSDPKKKDRLSFGLLEAQALLSHDCIVKIDGGMMPTEQGQPRIDMILCPTYKQETKNGLVFTSVVGVIGAAYRKQYNSKGVYIPLQLEPRATRLWEIGPSAETTIGN